MSKRLEWLWWTLLWLGLWIAAVVLGSIAVSNAYADHDGNDEPWRQPLLIACLHNDWVHEADTLRIVVDRPGYPQHGKSLHDQPFNVRDIFYRTWFRDTEDARAVDAHLIQWRREYECTHPPLPRGGGGPVTVDGGPRKPEGYGLNENGDGDTCRDTWTAEQCATFLWHCHEGAEPLDKDAPPWSVVEAADWHLDGSDGHADGLCNPYGATYAHRTWHAHFTDKTDHRHFG